jgi:hypothetical protein
MQAVYPRIGAVVIGRRVFDLTDGWCGVPAAGEHVFVVTHAPATDWKYAGTAPFTFVAEGVEAAITQARELVGPDRDVDVAVRPYRHQLGRPAADLSCDRQATHHDLASFPVRG